MGYLVSLIFLQLGAVYYMAINNRTIATNDIGRVFIQRSTGLLACCPEYLGCVGLGGLTQEREESLVIKCLSKTTAGKYDTVEKIAGALGQLTFDMTSFLGLNGISILRSLFQENCPSTIHVHFGVCDSPQLFTQFNKAIVLDDVLFESYSTDPMIVLSSGERAGIIETVSATAENVYEYFAEKNFTLVSELEETDELVLHLMDGGGDCGNVCVFCDNCTYSSCSEQFWTIPETSNIIDSFNVGSAIITIEDDGLVKQWNYALIIDGSASCTVLDTLTLEIGETIVSAAQYGNNLIVGTTDGRVIFYNLHTGMQDTVLTLLNEISIIEANEHGYLIADSVGEIYYSEKGNVWEGPTNTGAGVVTALHLYSETSWLVANINTNLYYTNNSGEDYSIKHYPNVLTQPITQFEQSNSAIINAINDTYFYQTFDTGCNWQAIDLSKYFSEIFSFDVCPTNPYVVYLAGLSVAGTETYVVELNFGA